MINYSADFETTRSLDGHSVRVWAWAVCNVDNYENYEIGTDISSFINFISEHPGTYFFHNLKYDGNYIVDFLMRSGWEFVTKKPRKTKQFTTMISRLGQWYSITLRIYNKKTRSSQIVKIQDSLKLLPLSVSAIAKAFSLEEGKGELDYDLYREEGHVITEEEEDYIRRDIQIVAQALKICFDEGMDKMTIGSNALSSWKKGFGKNWRRLFPKLGNACDAQVRQAYRGGFTYCMNDYKDIDVYNGISVDFNSMYPSMMILKDFPYGEPIPFEGKYEQDVRHPLYVQHMLATWKLKPNGIPFIKPSTMGIFDEHEYPEEVDEPIDLWVSNVDLELMNIMYDLDVWEYRGGWKFCKMAGSRIFGEYVSYWSARKISYDDKDPRRFIAKLYLNNLYGKFATKPEQVTKMPYISENGTISLKDSNKYPGIDMDGNECLCDISTRSAEPVYIPIAVFCTAWARDTLLRAIMKNRDRFIYCDTDSMHLYGTELPSGIGIDDRKLGYWKVEGTFSHARHLRAKTYMWDLNGTDEVVCAGMPKNIKEHVTWDNFHIGFSNVDSAGNVREGWGKLMNERLEGGVYLYEGKFEIKGE